MPSLGSASIRARLRKAQVGSCSCGVKSHVASHHADTCLYPLLVETEITLMALEQELRDARSAPRADLDGLDREQNPSTHTTEQALNAEANIPGLMRIPALRDEVDEEGNPRVVLNAAPLRECTCYVGGKLVPDMSCPVHCDRYGVLEEQCREDDDDA